ncbi:MAG: type II toxin-antitoxin system RelB/DinJ family antitoxin [Paludibacteraceae bacterium]|nr:type II toxin-antitoxin system RelB/DinJ family antitoxin [Paludibacteraceae bacterium]
MAQVSMTVRMDSELKKMFDSLCAQFGMSANAAMNVFAKAVVQRRCIPFEIRADEPAYTQKGLNSFAELRNIACEAENSNMSLDEINVEISGYRKERKKK